MNGQILMQWLTPCLLVGFGLAFLLLARRSVRLDRTSLVLAASYLIGAFAFGLDLVFMGFAEWISILEDVGYLGSATLLGIGVRMHLGGRPPLAATLAVLVAALAANVHYTLFDLQVEVRTLVLSLSSAVLMGIGVIGGPGRRTVDRCVVGFVVLLCLSIATNAMLNAETFAAGGVLAEASSFTAVLNFVVAVLTTAIAVTLLIDHALRTIRELRDASETDPLTGVLNRRGFERRAEEMLRDRSSGGALVVMADIDRFKSVNDTYGHAIGDKVIRALAQLLQAHFAPDHPIGRLGGEEFCIILSGYDVAEGRRVVDKAREAFTEAATFALPQQRTTASFGVAPLTTDLSASLKAADLALYEAKETGRDRVVCAGPDPVLAVAA